MIGLILLPIGLMAVAVSAIVGVGILKKSTASKADAAQSSVGETVIQS